MDTQNIKHKNVEPIIIIKKVYKDAWIDVINSARMTQRKTPINKEPSDNFKRKIIKAEHSPLRCLVYNIDMYNIPYYVSTHFVRHIHAQPFVSTSRPDIDGTQKPRALQHKDDLVNMRLVVNAEELINISKVRCCFKAESTTRKIWTEVVEKLKIIDPILAEACVPSCIYRGFCPEMQPCKFSETPVYKEKLNHYREIFK